MSLEIPGVFGSSSYQAPVDQMAHPQQQTPPQKSNSQSARFQMKTTPRVIEFNNKTM